MLVKLKNDFATDTSAARSILIKSKNTTTNKYNSNNSNSNKKTRKCRLEKWNLIYPWPVNAND